MDCKKLIKLLSLSQSANDNEALSAVRRANELLRKFDKTWDKVIIDSCSMGEIMTPSESIPFNQQLEFLMDYEELLPLREATLVREIYNTYYNQHDVSDKMKKKIWTIYTKIKMAASSN
jgi:hypothetical protein